MAVREADRRSAALRRLLPLVKLVKLVLLVAGAAGADKIVKASFVVIIVVVIPRNSTDLVTVFDGKAIMDSNER